MSEFAGKTTVAVHAHSPGERSILIVETPDGTYLALHSETGYDVEKGKPVEKDWITENAVGRHSFVEVSPPEEVEASELRGYAAD